MGIISLYTVISNNEGLQALNYFLNQRLVKKSSSETLLDLAELVLTLNCFHLVTTVTNKSTGLQWGAKWDPATPTSS